MIIFRLFYANQKSKGVKCFAKIQQLKDYVSQMKNKSDIIGIVKGGKNINYLVKNGVKNEIEQI